MTALYYVSTHSAAPVCSREREREGGRGRQREEREESGGGEETHSDALMEIAFKNY